MKDLKKILNNKTIWILIGLKSLIKLIFILIILSGFNSCKDLQVDNPNDPDTEEVLNDTGLLKNLANQAYLNFWQATHGDNIHLTSLVMADQFTSSGANYGWQRNSNEPQRLPFENFIFSDDDDVLDNLWENTYSALSQANSLIDRINNGIDLGGDSINQMYLALGYHIQGLCLGNLALVFDQALIRTDENIDIEKLEYSKYDSVMSAAKSALFKSIHICDSSDFLLPLSIINEVPVNQDLLKQYNYSFLARFTVLNSRNKAENDIVNWAEVINYTNQGIFNDFGPLGNGLPSLGGTWYDLNFYRITDPGLCRVDCRILNLMDQNYPSTYPLDGSEPTRYPGVTAGRAFSGDARLETDFNFYSSVPFPSERGYYHFSKYSYSRYNNTITQAKGQLVEMRYYEMYLYLAEAQLMLNKPSIALSIINFNSFPRNARGKLADLSSNTKTDEILKAIFYEREIELLGQGFMIGFCDMRRRDLLQKGTPLHFPVPSKVLQSRGETVYTFGGDQGVPGKDISIGGWK